MPTTPFDRLPRRVRHALHTAGIRTLGDLLAADRTSLDLSAADKRRLEYLVERATPPSAPAHQEQPAASNGQPAAPLTAADLAANLPPLLTTSQAAAFLQLNRRTVAAMCADGRIAARKLGDDWRIPCQSIVTLLEENP